jgi:peptide deformylase
MSTYDPTGRYVLPTVEIDFIEEKWEPTLVDPSHPALRRPSTLNPFSNNKVDWVQREKQMIRLMKEHWGQGLSAPQTGSNYRMFVMTHSALGDIGVYNPVIIWESDDKVKMEEGCLTWPLLYLSVKRSGQIKVQFERLKVGVPVKVEMMMDGMDARCFLHEFEHLNGMTYLHNVSDFQVRRAKERRDKMLKKISRQK